MLEQLILASYTWKVAAIKCINRWCFFCRNYGCAQLWGFDCVSMRYVIHAVNVTSLTARKPNNFFKRPKFRTLFSLKRHFSNPAENYWEISSVAVKASGSASGFKKKKKKIAESFHIRTNLLEGWRANQLQSSYIKKKKDQKLELSFDHFAVPSTNPNLKSLLGSLPRSWK